MSLQNFLKQEMNFFFISHMYIYMQFYLLQVFLSLLEAYNSFEEKKGKHFWIFEDIGKTGDKCFLTLSQTTNFRFFQSERFVDDNFKFDENGRKFSNRVENTVGKGEIAHYEQLLLFLQCFQKTCTSDM